MPTAEEQLTASRTRLLKALGDLRDEDVNWREDDVTWTIAQVVQHIALVQKSSAQLVTLGLREEPTFVPNDLPLDKLIPDRTRRVMAPERVHPPTDPKTVVELKEILQDSEDLLLAVLRNVEDPSKLKVTSPPIEHPVFGRLSSEQWVQASHLHEERHIQQIEELKSRLNRV